MKRTHLPLATLLLLYLVLSPIPGWAQTNPATANPATETLSGRVVLRFDGTPERGTRIWIFDEKSDKQYTAQQNAKGEFSITLLEGYYVVLIMNPGLIPYAKEIWLQHGHPIKLMVKLDVDGAILQDTR